MLEIEELEKEFQGPKGEVLALRGVSLKVESGEFVVVRGPSGCGKSTLLLAAGGLQEPTGGKVMVDGQDIYALSQNDRARFRGERIGFVFQQFHLIPYLSVFDNVLAPSLAVPTPRVEERARELIGRFGLTERLHHVPGALSTGEKQRTALARALLLEPKLILADEPTGNLDGENAASVLSALSEFCTQGGAVLLVTHDASAAAYGQRTVHLEQGRVV